MQKKKQCSASRCEVGCGDESTFGTSSSRRAAYGYEERIEVFGSEGLAESRRQNFRGMAHQKARTMIEDCLRPGWFEHFEASYYNLARGPRDGTQSLVRGWS
jgi:hypothetical protein